MTLQLAGAGTAASSTSKSNGTMEPATTICQSTGETRRQGHSRVGHVHLHPEQGILGETLTPRTPVIPATARLALAYASSHRRGPVGGSMNLRLLAAGLASGTGSGTPPPCSLSRPWRHFQVAWNFQLQLRSASGSSVNSSAGPASKITARQKAGPGPMIACTQVGQSSSLQAAFSPAGGKRRR